MSQNESKRRNWTREETLLAFRLYCYTPFGKLHTGNPDIIQLAERIGRSPGAVGMKACNFASLDPLHQARGVVGLSNRSKIEEQIWEEFMSNSEVIADEAEQANETFLLSPDSQVEPPEMSAPHGPSEVSRTVRTRRVQSFFRQAVLTSYNSRCALTGLAIPALLNASHIIPWAASEQHRADPTNGLCLNALHDRAFDRGFISFDDQLRLIKSPAIDKIDGHTSQRWFADLVNQSLELPDRFKPSLEAIRHHRENIFLVS